MELKNLSVNYRLKNPKAPTSALRNKLFLLKQEKPATIITRISSTVASTTSSKKNKTNDKDKDKDKDKNKDNPKDQSKDMDKDNDTDLWFHSKRTNG